MILNQKVLASVAGVFILSAAVLGQIPTLSPPAVAFPPGPTVPVFEGDYHLASCPRLAGVMPQFMTLREAILAGAKPCTACKPNDDPPIGSFDVSYGAAIRSRIADYERARAARVSFDAAAADAFRVATEAAEAESHLADEARAAERRRKEAEPLIRVTAAQAVAMIRVAAKLASNDADSFERAFLDSVAKIAPDYRGPQFMDAPDGLTIMVLGPLAMFYSEARERVRKFEPLSPPPSGRRRFASSSARARSAPQTSKK